MSKRTKPDGEPCCGHKGCTSTLKMHHVDDVRTYCQKHAKQWKTYHRTWDDGKTHKERMQEELVLGVPGARGGSKTGMSSPSANDLIREAMEENRQFRKRMHRWRKTTCANEGCMNKVFAPPKVNYCNACIKKFKTQRRQQKSEDKKEIQQAMINLARRKGLIK